MKNIIHETLHGAIRVRRYLNYTVTVYYKRIKWLNKRLINFCTTARSVESGLDIRCANRDA